LSGFSRGGCAAERCDGTLGITPVGDAVGYKLTAQPAVGSNDGCSLDSCAVSFPASQPVCYSVQAVDSAGRTSPASNQVCLPLT
jgi:hypothetical protein